ncbi:MAG: SulP family inorganic anion transporter [Microlunatus sp.]|nr:SulP family inorganic anion transporter [Microlunatus sp.]
MSGATAAPTGRARLKRIVPILDWLPRYDRRRLRPDLLAGAVVAALAVPQSLGYAAIAGVPVEVGLYAVPVALIAYAIFGSSRQLIIGPVSTVSVMSGALVVALQPTDVAQAVLFTAAAALWAGIFLLIAARLRIGWVAEFLSKPIITGFVMGLTLLVIVGELPNLLGIVVGPRDVLGRIRGLLAGLGQVDVLTASLALISLVVLFVGSRLLRQVPWSLVVLVLGLLASRVFDLAGLGVPVVGFVPAGLPAPHFPLVPLDRLVDVATAGAALAFVGLAEGLSAARLFAVRRGYRIRTDQELLAAGASNLASGLVGGLGVAGSLSKTAALDRARGRSQMAGLAAAVLSLLAIAFFAPAVGLLPPAVLSAIVVHAVWGLIDLPAMRRYRQSRRVDFLSACVAVIGVLIAGPLIGLLIAIGWAILGLVYRSSRVSVDVMGKVPGEKAAWGALENHAERTTVPGVLVLRVNESLFWVNAARVKERIQEIVDDFPDTKALVLDLESTDQLEITSADMLALLLERLRARGIDLYLVRVRFRVRTLLGNTGVRASIGEDHLWHSITQGVRAARRDHGLKPPKPEPAVSLAPRPLVEADHSTVDAPPAIRATERVESVGPVEPVGPVGPRPRFGDDDGVPTGAGRLSRDRTPAKDSFDDDDLPDAADEVVISRSMDVHPDELDREEAETDEPTEGLEVILRDADRTAHPKKKKKGKKKKHGKKGKKHKKHGNHSHHHDYDHSESGPDSP